MLTGSALNIRTVIIVLSSLITIVATVPYLIDVARGRDKPRIATWLVWAVLAGVGSAAAFASHQIPAAVFTLVTGLEAAAVAVLGLREGDREFGRLDIACLVAAVVGLVFLLFLKSPTLAMTVVIVTDAVGTIPTMVHAWKRPFEETWITYGLFVLGEAMILAIADFSVLTGFAYPLFYLIEDATLAAFVLFSPHRIDRSSEAAVRAESVVTVPSENANVVASVGVGVGPRPAAPAGLTVSSPTQIPTLRWESVPGAVSYNIYRNGGLCGSSAAATFSDAKATDGTYSYGVTAVGPGGESGLGNAVSVRVDQSPPALSYQLSDKPNRAGWYKSPVTISFSGNDPMAGIASCTQPVTLSGDGANQAVTGSAMNYAGATSSITAVVNVDQTPPTLGVPSWSVNPVEAGSETEVVVPVVDHSSGVASGEYVGRIDPGRGHGRPMALKNGHLSVALNTNVHPGSYPINIRAVDAAGNWSETMTTTIVVTEKARAAQAVTT